ncbi:MAG: hypothetical protein ACW981_15160 [Candidatus Hodarchaeales archaeon]|jgi:hypothetical protein
MSDSKEKKSEKDLDKLVSNVGKVYTQWIKKGFIGPADSSTTKLSEDFEVPDDETEEIDLPITKKKKTENL